MDRLDINVHDDELRNEIKLVADLMIAANQSKEHLSGVDIDVLLGLRPYDTGDGSRSGDGSASSRRVPEQRAAPMRPDDADPA